MSGKGYRRRPAVIPLEEANLKWDVTFAKTHELEQKAIQALTEYYERRKSAYIEKEKRNAVI